MNFDSKLLSLSSVAEVLGVDNAVVADLILCGDLPAVGSKKDFVLSACLSRFVDGSVPIAAPAATLSVASAAPIAGVLFRDFLDNYLSLIQNSMSSSGFSGLYSHGQHIYSALGDCNLCDLTSDDITRFLNSMTVKTYVRGLKGTPQLFGQDIINKVFYLLSNALHDAYRKGHTAVDLSLDLKKPRSKKLHVEANKELSDTDILTLERIVRRDLSLCAMIYILLYTGMRPAECKALKFSDFDFTDKTISVARTLKREIPLDISTGLRGVPFASVGNLKNYSSNRRVNHSFRTLIVSDKVIAAVSALRESIYHNVDYFAQRLENKNDDYLFTGVDGTLVVPDYYDQRYSRLLTQHGYCYGDFSLYKLRHTYCSRMCRSGVNPKTIARSMGDNTISMVMEVYNNVNKEDVLDASREYANNMDFTLEKCKKRSKS